jgi:hypothetical protein
MQTQMLAAVGAVGVIGGLAMGSVARAAAVSTTFQVTQATSQLMVEIEARGFTDDDTQPLAGTIDATLDFGSSGAFPQQASVNVTGADIAAVSDFEFRLGLPQPFPGADVVASGIVAHVTTPTPPAPLTRLSGSGVTYQFDAANFLISADEGTIVVTGFVDDTADLSETPVAGTSPVGTFGTLTLTPGATTGFYTLVNASMTFPINITDVAEFGDEADPEEVVLDLDATINATASFYVALAGVPGDFDNDGDVDGGDLARWRTGFGKGVGAVATDGDADGDQDVDGADFLVWQRNLGTAPPTLGATGVPEPGAATLLLGALAGLGALRWRVAAKRSASTSGCEFRRNSAAVSPRGGRCG